MTEQELLQENERLRRELAEMTRSRDRLSGWLCDVLGFAPMTDEELQEMQERPGRDVDDLLRNLLPAEMQHLIEERKNEQPTNRVSA